MVRERKNTLKLENVVNWIKRWSSWNFPANIFTFFPGDGFLIHENTKKCNIFGIFLTFYQFTSPKGLKSPRNT